MVGGLGDSDDKFHIVNLSAAGDHTAIAATTVQAVFVAPCACHIVDIGMEVTTSVAAHTSNHWTISVANQTGSKAMLSDSFDTDSDETGNGGRAFTANTYLSLCVNSSGTNYLQNAVLAKGDMLVATLTKAASADNLTYPVMVIRYR